MNDAATYALRLGDDALVLAQRLSEWSSRAHDLEEDLALTNIALDLLGQARALLGRAGELEGEGRDEDDLAYLRGDREFLNVLLVEQPNGDFARTIARQLLFSTYQLALYDRLCDSADLVLSGVAGKAVKEVAYHRDHAVQWTLRLAGGTEESRSRMLVALADTWPYIDELFRDDELHERLGDIAPRPSSLRAGFDEIWAAVLAEAEIAESDFVSPKIGQSSGGGRFGNHSTHLGPLLAEMQVLARRHPGATW